MMRSSLTLGLLFLVNILLAQSVFDFGKSEEIYFISSDEREEFGIIQIFEHSESKTKGGMNETWDLSIFDFDPPDHNFTMNWYINVDTIGLDTLDLSDNYYFVNGQYLDFDIDQITGAGAFGYGTLGETYYESKLDYIEGITTYIRNTETFECSRTYYVDGLPYKVIYFGGDTLSYYTIENNPNYDRILDSLALLSNDSIIILYDSLERFMNSYNQNDKKPTQYFFEEKNDHKFQYYKYYQLTIEGMAMADYIENELGIIPQILMIEIYPYSIILFKYDARSKKYYFESNLVLEG